MAQTCFVAHATTVADCLSNLQTSEKVGLTEAQVKERIAQYGLNELEKEEQEPLWKLILAQFKDTLVLILLASAGVSFVLAFFEEHGEITAFVELFVILLILILNAVVGVWQEHNAANALAALKELQSTHARALRNGVWDHELDARQLVPGDVVEVRVGDKCPADCRILRLKTTTFRTDEAALTGESTTVQKHCEPVGLNVKIQDKKNMIFAGTTVSGGACTVIVVDTGMSTEIGRIQQDVKAAKEEEEKTPLGQKLDAFGENLAKIIGVICVLVWVMNFRQFSDPVHGGMVRGMIYYLKIAVALGVAAIPEGLPAVITLCLALGTRKMVKRNAIIRKLPSVETLGCCTVICSDKTGTLTTNQMTAVSMVIFDSSTSGATPKISEFAVGGNSYSPLDGKVVGLEQGIQQGDDGLQDFAKVCVLCNEAEITYKDGKFDRVGEPTEAALKVLAEKLGHPSKPSSVSPDAACKAASTFWAQGLSRVALLEFSRDRKSMSVIIRPKDSTSSSKSNLLLCKGAPEGVLSRCTMIRTRNGTTTTLNETTRKAILEKISEISCRPLRCIALAVKEKGQLPDNLATYDGCTQHAAHSLLLKTEGFVDIERDMVLLGLIGIKDPARPEVRHAIEQCDTAGVRVIMITGDNKSTAEAIGRDIRMFRANENLRNKSFTGEEFFKFPEDERRKLLMEGGGSRIFSRTEPRDKQALVKLLRDLDEVPAMTGDGVNDAPALQQAAIGIAMGISGTEVAKEASDMVLADDNFATIVSAIEEGRAIYANMKAFIRYLISSNIGEVASIFITALLGIPEGLIPVQLLWVNLVTDGPPATALGFNPPSDDIMEVPPRRKDDKLITPWVFFRYMLIGCYVGIATVGVFIFWYLVDYSGDGHTTVTMHQLMHWHHCPTWGNDFVNPTLGQGYTDLNSHFAEKPCLYFSEGKKMASTLSLSVLVTIEMFNAMNAVSEDCSLLHMPPWCNPYLMLAIAGSMSVHFLVLYIPVLARIFSLAPLSLMDWTVVTLFSFPVILIDEGLKCVSRALNRQVSAKRKKHE